jgi:hypothetical protein
VTYCDELRRALAEVGIRGRLARRILAEFDDHLACDPAAAARLGDPRAIAEEFVNQLASVRARRSALVAFLALAGTAAALAAPLVAVDYAGGYPDIFAGRSFALSALAGIGLFVAPQFALVAGGLAGIRAFRRRGVPVLPASEVALLRRRVTVGLVAGAATMAGLVLYAVNFTAQMPGWWTALALACAAATLPATGLGVAGLGRVRALRPVAVGDAGDLADDFPLAAVRRLQDRPWLLGAAVGLPVLVATFAAGSVGEGNLASGMLDASLEAVAFLAGFMVLGRFLGIRR